VYGWDPQEAARIAVRTLADTPTDVQEVTLVAFNEDGRSAWRSAVEETG
jgi:O-acetyl-ADP-ribose deacetylase